MGALTPMWSKYRKCRFESSDVEGEKKLPDSALAHLAGSQTNTQVVSSQQRGTPHRLDLVLRYVRIAKSCLGGGRGFCSLGINLKDQITDADLCIYFVMSKCSEKAICLQLYRAKNTHYIALEVSELYLFTIVRSRSDRARASLECSMQSHIHTVYIARH